MSPPNCISIPLHAKAVTKVVDPIPTPSHCSKLFGYDRRILRFLDVKAKECTEHVIDKQEGTEYNKGSFGASKYAWFHIDYMERAHYFVDIDTCE